MMDAIVETVDIDRPPEDVFAYATDFSCFPEWQVGVESTRPDRDEPPALGSKASVIRHVGPRKLSRTEEIIEFDRPRSWTVRGVGGPLTATAKGTIEPLNGGRRSRLTIALEFDGHGIGKSLLPVVRRQAQRQLPTNQRRLKERLERDRFN